jgi:CPA2 family monovalent cation:H+ antiporter-2
MRPRELWLMRSKIFVMGGLQICLTTILVMTISMGFGYVWTMSLTIGLVFGLSSTAIVNQTLIEKRLLKSTGGRYSLAVLLAQDIMVIPILIMLPLLASPDLIELVLVELLELTDVNQQDYHVTVNSVSLVEGLNGWQAAAVTFMAVGGVIILGKFAVTPLFRFVAQARLRELFLSTALLVVVGIALLMTLVGLPPALGAFLAGVVLASSEYKFELENNIDPYRGLLLGLFFITIGAGINFDLLFNSFTIIISLTVGLIILKSVVLLLLAVIYNLKGTDRWLFSLGLAQAGEFGFVLVTLSVTKAVLPKELADTLILIVTLSMLLTPMIFFIYDKFLVPPKIKL